MRSSTVNEPIRVFSVFSRLQTLSNHTRLFTRFVYDWLNDSSSREKCQICSNVFFGYLFRQCEKMSFKRLTSVVCTYLDFENITRSSDFFIYIYMKFWNLIYFMFNDITIETVLKTPSSSVNYSQDNNKFVQILFSIWAINDWYMFY